MRLPVKTIQNLKNGDSKEVISFAWLPKRIGNVRVWLESYVTLYAWIVLEYVIPIEGKEMKFTVGNWTVMSQQPVKVVNEKLV